MENIKMYIYDVERLSKEEGLVYEPASKYDSSWADHMQLYHGVMSGFEGDVTLIEAFNRINNVNNTLSTIELCCSNMAIGPVGIKLVGHNLVVSNTDLYSVTGMDYKKYIAEYSPIIKTADKYCPLEYSEHIVIAQDILCIWCDDQYEYIEEVKHYAKSKGYLFEAIPHEDVLFY